MKKAKLLYFYTNTSTFVRKDIGFLSAQFNVIPFSFLPSRKSFTIFEFIRQFFFLIWFLPGAKVMTCQFSAYHSLLPALLGRIFRKPCLIVAGGTDCVSFPSISYGNFRKKALGWFTGMSFRLASHISPVHESLVEYDYTYQADDYPKQGFRYFRPELKTPVTIIYNGYDAKKWYAKKEKVKNRFVTVVAGYRDNILYLKGIDLIIDMAGHFPECEFILIGLKDEATAGKYPANITVIPFVKNESLVDFISSAEFYLQLSMSEGFPNALCEAMLCECVPIVSNVGGNAFIVGDSGYILKKKSTDELAMLLRTAMASDTVILAKKARKRIEENFTEERRDKALNELLRSLI